MKMVFEDTEIRAVHKVNLNEFHQAHATSAGDEVSANCQANGKIAQAHAQLFEDSPFECCTDVKEDVKKSRMKNLMDSAKIAYADGEYSLCEALAKEALQVNPNELAAGMLIFKAKSDRRFPELVSCGYGRDNETVLEFPEIAKEEILGEWLIPKGDCLLVSFGPHTVADKDGKAIVHERLAFVEAEEVTGVMANAATRFIVTPSPSSSISSSPTPAPFEPVTAPAPMPGLPVIIERAPLPSHVYPPALRKLPGMEMPTPPVPTRSFPEGVHSDGSKAKLPELPDDEMEDESAESESAEPRPSPQSKKPSKPAAAPTPAPAPATTRQPRRRASPSPGRRPCFFRASFCPGLPSAFSSCCRSSRFR